MNLIAQFQKKYQKKQIPELRSGDVLRVHQKITEGKKSRIQTFEGLVIKLSGGRNLNGTFTLRRKSFGVGVEITFPLHSPDIIKIEKIKHVNVSRSKLYYLRDLTDRQIKAKGEFADVAVWEEKDAQAEEEELKKQQEAEAQKKEEAKKKEEEALEKKFAAAKGEIAKNKEEKKEDKKEGTDDTSKQESGK